MRAIARRRERIGGQVVDGLLVRLHPRHVVVECHIGRIAVRLRGVEPQQLCDAGLLARIVDHALLQHDAEGLPEFGVLLRLVFGEFLEQIERALDERGFDFLDGAIVLQQLARHIERQIRGVDESAHEPQPRRQQFRRLVHDEHPLHVQLHAAARIALEQIERGALGQVQERGILDVAFDLVVRPGTCLLAVMRQVFVERLIVLRRQVGFRPRPKCLRLIQGLLGIGALQQDGNAQVVGIFAHQLFQARGFQKFLVFLAQVHDDLGAAIGLIRGLDLVGTLAIGIPAHRVRIRALGEYGHAVRHDESRVKPDAELTDQLRVLG